MWINATSFSMLLLLVNKRVLSSLSQQKMEMEAERDFFYFVSNDSTNRWSARNVSRDSNG